jgi:hypothetical protein
MEMTEPTIESLQQELKQALERERQLKRLVFRSVPMKRRLYAITAIKRLFADPDRGFGGANEYEIWLRSLDYYDLDRLSRLYESLIDQLRYMKRFALCELERRGLHSNYGKYDPDLLLTISKEDSHDVG